MTARLALTAAAACLLAQGVPAASAQTDKPAAEPAAPQTSALMQSCSAHKFETTVRYVAAGITHSSKVKLCGTAGQSDAEWIGTLKDAADKIRADADMPPAKRDTIVAALTAEIARVQSGAAPAAATASILPSLKTADPTPPARDPLSGYTVFKPLPPPPPPRKSASVAAGTVAAAAAAPALPAPQLTIRCGDLINRRVDETCTSLEPETVLMVRADENLPAGLSLRFMRRGDARGEVALARLAQGQSVRVRPPKALCAGIVHSSAEIQLLRQGSGGESVVDTMGPYELRC